MAKELMNGEAESAEAPEATGRKMDPELRVMGTLLRTLEELEEPARGRAVRWLSDRYQESRA